MIPKYLMFSKMLQEYPLDRLGEVVVGMGFDGVDLTVRPCGHIEPSEVIERLPYAVRELRSHGLETGMLTTGILRADEPHTEAIFRAAAEQGIRYLKLGYWRYSGFGTLSGQIEQAREWVDDLAQLARTYGVTATIHTHSGDYLSATSGMLRALLDGTHPDEIGAYVDPRHMTVEGSLGGWMQGLDLLAPWVRLVGVKSAGWFREGDAWLVKNMPLSEGAVRWRAVLDCLEQIGYNGYFSFHSEYDGRGSWRDLSTAEIIEQTRADLAYFKSIANRNGDTA